MSLSPVKDAESGTAVAADEVELARMGYKQELKFVHISVVVSFANIFLSPRRDLSLMQVNGSESLQELVFHDLYFRISVSRSPLLVS